MSACPFCGRQPRTGHLYEICVLDGREERDSDGTASAALCEDIAVPQDCQARAEGIAQPLPSSDKERE